MMDIAFINLIADGIVRLCREPGKPADTAPRDFDATVIIRELTAFAPAPTGELINRCVTDLWQSCRTVGLPVELAEPHVAALSGILRRAYLRPSEMSYFLEPDTAAEAGAIAALSKRIITSEKDAFTSEGLDAVVLSYLLETFLESMFACREIVQTSRQFIRAKLARSEPTLGPKHDTGNKSASAAVTLAKIERADALGITVPLLEAITVALINLTKSANLSHDDLLAAANDAVTFEDTLQQLAEHIPRYAAPLSQALAAFRAGRTADCARMLGPVEDDIIQRSVETAPHDSDLAKLASRLRAVRAGLHSLTGSYVKAARHYGFAQRYVPRAQVEMRWHFANLEAGHYELAAFHQANANGLENAARACTGTLAGIPDGPAFAHLRAEVQAALARILIFLGEREQDQSRFELAAQLLADAHAYFETGTELADGQQSVSGPSDIQSAALENFHNVTVLRATALTRLGELSKTSNLLEQAAVLLQTLITGQSLPRPVMTRIRTHLALALISFGRMENEAALIEQAVATITRDLPALEPPPPSYGRAEFSEHILAARCHLALATAQSAIDATKASDEHIAQAADLFAAAGFHALSQSLMNASAPTEPKPGELPGNLTDGEANAA